MQPENENPYGFIFDPSKQQRPPKFQPRSNANKILVSVGFVTGVIVVLIIGFSLITSIGKGSNNDLILVREEQTELARVLELGVKNVSDITTKNTMASLQSSLTSDSTSLKTLLDKRKVKIDKAVIDSKKNTETDKALEAAQQNGTYDTAFVKSINALLTSYYSALKTAKLDAQSSEEKELLDQATTNLEKYEATQKNL